MSETVHIAELAGKISKEIFLNLGWKKSAGPTDYRWPCALHEKHGKERKIKQHPTDVVFQYDDPYLGKTVYVNCDLKSYARTTVEKYNPHDDLLSLAAAVECANVSEHFQNLYVYEGSPWTIEGMLFVFNHDKEYDRDFQVPLDKAPKKTSISGKNRLFIVGPKRIADLYSVSRDLDTRIAKLTRDKEFEGGGFIAPDLDITKVKGNMVGSATLEMITGPWLIHQLIGSTQKSIQVYYLDGVPTKNDFKFLIDGLIHFQLLGDMSLIEICVIESDATVATAFVTAKKEYAAEYHGITDESLTAFTKRLERIGYASVAKISPPFFELEQALPNG